MNEAGKNRNSFLFAINFEMTEGLFILNPLEQQNILFDIKGITNVHSKVKKTASDRLEETSYSHLFKAYPEDFNIYQHRFHSVMNGLKRGDSYLTNLTIKTPLQMPFSLENIFHISNASYKICIPNKWVCFSPECFVQMKKGMILTYPMKGTIDALLPNASEIILNDMKETAEHNTIVDLLRNDLSKISTSVKVNRFRYIEKLQTHNGSLLQVSSEIQGLLPDGYLDQIGTLLFQLLPAGSVSGAPKESTLRIIKNSESELRGFYTGIAGYFDRQALESFVLIRFIEQQESQFFFRSGGGITTNSNVTKEYKEAIQKIYIPSKHQLSCL